jgi:hypothetical protein
MDDECFICHDRLNKLGVVLPKRDATGFSTAVKCRKASLNEQEPERELFCPVCGMETTVVGIDAVVHYENPKDLDYVIASLDSG